MTDDAELVADQIRYYRRRAPEYDETSTPDNDPLADETAELRAALERFEPRGDVLELAAGTGTWTRELARFADRLTAVDASPEMLELNRAKVGGEHVSYVVADVFEYRPPQPYDVVAFAFWLSHVPPARFADFWESVATALKPDGRVFFVDQARHGLWREDWVDEDRAVVQRRLRDGTQHRLVKVLWDPDELRERLATLGWDVEVRGTGTFYWGAGSRGAASSAPRA